MLNRERVYKYSYEDNNKYCYPNSDILINKLGIKDESEYYSIERSITTIRQTVLNMYPLDGSLDFNHLKAIHKYLFQDIYDWAGKTRTVNIAKSDLFCLVEHIDSFGNDIFKRLKKDDYLRGLTQDKFITELSNLLGDINALHPFREGNGRTQREFIRYVAALNGYSLKWSKVDVEENIIASHESINGNNEKLNSIISRIICPLDKDDVEIFKDLFKNI